VRSTSQIRSRTGAIDARTSSCKRTAISCCVTSPTTSPGSWGHPGEYFDAHFDAEEDAIVFRRLAGKDLPSGVAMCGSSHGSSRKRSVLHERGHRRTAGVLGAIEARTPAPSAAGVVGPLQPPWTGRWQREEGSRSRWLRLRTAATVSFGRSKRGFQGAPMRASFDI
jgi:hypothetical protein